MIWGRTPRISWVLVLFAILRPIATSAVVIIVISRVALVVIVLGLLGRILVGAPHLAGIWALLRLVSPFISHGDVFAAI